MSFCVYCQRGVAPGVQYCPQCGEDLAEMAAASPVYADPAPPPPLPPLQPLPKPAPTLFSPWRVLVLLFLLLVVLPAALYDLGVFSPPSPALLTPVEPTRPVGTAPTVAAPATAAAPPADAPPMVLTRPVAPTPTVPPGTMPLPPHPVYAPNPYGPNDPSFGHPNFGPRRPVIIYRYGPPPPDAAPATSPGPDVPQAPPYFPPAPTAPVNTPGPSAPAAPPIQPGG